MTETNTQVKERLKYQLDGPQADEEMALKLILGLEPDEPLSNLQDGSGDD